MGCLKIGSEWRYLKVKIKWKPLKGYEDRYLVSNFGDVYSLKTKTYMKGYFNENGYRSVSISKDGKHKNRVVHRMVAQLFIENHENKPCVNHIDGNKANNKASNLEWVTYSENNVHAYEKGLRVPPSGNKHWAKRKRIYRKLSDEKVLEIKEKLDRGQTQMSLAAEYKVSQRTIWNISKRRNSLFKNSIS